MCQGKPSAFSGVRRGNACGLMGWPPMGSVTIKVYKPSCNVGGFRATLEWRRILPPEKGSAWRVFLKFTWLVWLPPRTDVWACWGLHIMCFLISSRQDTWNPWRLVVEFVSYKTYLYAHTYEHSFPKLPLRIWRVHLKSHHRSQFQFIWPWQRPFMIFPKHPKQWFWRWLLGCSSVNSSTPMEACCALLRAGCSLRLCNLEAKSESPNQSRVYRDMEVPVSTL